jgi:Flp pilus assembly protein TadG
MHDWPVAHFFRRWLRSAISKARGDRRGAVAMIMGLSLSVMLGVAGLAVDASMWQYTKNDAQGAADAAAMSAVTSAIAGNSSGRIASEVYSVAAINGFVRGNGATVTLNNPPANGNYAGNVNAYEVIISELGPRYFSLLYTKGAPTIAARAVALVTVSGGAGCVISLATSGAQAVVASNGAGVSLNGCGLYANSNNADAFDLSGGASFSAQSIQLAGNYKISNGARLTGTVSTGASPITDPYASYAIPSYSGCTKSNYSIGGGAAVTLPTSGTGVTVFCNGLAIGNGATVTVPAGIYIIDGGSLDFGGGASITGTGVTFIITSHTGTGIGYFTIDNGVSVTLTAPTTGPTAGIVLWVDKKAAATDNPSSFAGGSSASLTGAVYAPSSSVAFSNGTSNASACTQVVANTVSFVGGASFKHNCAGTGVRDPTTTTQSGKPVE